MLALETKKFGGKLHHHSELWGGEFLEETSRSIQRGIIILGLISRRWDVGIWTGLGWPK